MADNQPPAKWIQDLVRRSYIARGRYLTSYAQCEFLLADISVKVDDRFRYALDKRISAAKIMAEKGGRLDAYADEFVPLIEGITGWSDRRHWFAHGFLTVAHSKSGYHAFELRRYVQEEGKYRLIKWIADIDELENAASSINVYCIAFVALYRRIYTELDIESML